MYPGQKIKTSSSPAEIDERWEVTCLARDKINLIKKLEKRVVYDSNLPSMREVYTQLDDTEWEWTSFLSGVSKGSPLKDFEYYCNVFYSEMIKRVHKKGNKDAKKFLRENKGYSIIVANWIFNNHLLAFGRCFRIINKSICIYAMDSSARSAILDSTYEVLRYSGCYVPLREQGTMFKRFPSRDIPSVFDLGNAWIREFLFLDGTGCCDPKLLRDLMYYLSCHDSVLFGRCFPAILNLNGPQRNPENRKLLVEFTI